MLPSGGVTSDTITGTGTISTSGFGWTDTTVFDIITGGVDFTLLTVLNESEEPKNSSNLSTFDLISSFCFNNLPWSSLDMYLKWTTSFLSSSILFVTFLNCPLLTFNIITWELSKNFWLCAPPIKDLILSNNEAPVESFCIFVAATTLSSSFNIWITWSLISLGILRIIWS